MGRAKKQIEKKQKKAATKKDTPTLLNRKAHHEFEVLETLQAGLLLTGTEVKSLRLGRGQLGEGFIKINKQCEAFLYGTTIPKYEYGNRYNHEPDRIRKLLLTRKELQKWKARVDREKLTIIPLKLYFKGSWVKVLIGLAKRKLQHDKRKELKEKAVNRDINREVKSKGFSIK
ncbi:MAG: SsrA-binding protein SmpB [Candidatus Caenarcaniphilales bacterium]|nr:SsrA-binding protein SmpB [Candidatus Caenarcaniphilales bacterium]